MNQQVTEQRIAFVDWIRVIACFMVMLVHASENFYGADNSGLAGNMSMLANESNRFWVAFYDGGVGRTAVPLFMTISAFLLIPLKPGMSMTEFYRRRMLRILPPMLVFMLLYCFIKKSAAVIMIVSFLPIISDLVSMVVIGMTGKEFGAYLSYFTLMDDILFINPDSTQNVIGYSIFGISTIIFVIAAALVFRKEDIN